jgi:SAM-dependent methyltransferase
MSEVPPEARLWDLMRGTMTAKALAVASDLDIADALADGPRSSTNLAAEKGADADTLHRVLRALAGDGVFSEGEPGVFSNTEASELLRRDRGDGWPEFAHLFGGVFAEAIAGLDPRTRGETFSERFETEFWSWLAVHPDERGVFDAAMAGGKERSAERLAGLEWRDDETVVDVGGGNGALLRGLLQRRPRLHGIAFDLPETVRDERALGDRISFVAGDFFERVPTGDAYVLSTILHDWDNERAAAILGTIRVAAPASARLFILDSVVGQGNEPSGAKWLDLLMLVLAGGRERTEPEWRRLIESAGFRIEQIEDRLIQARCR